MDGLLNLVEFARDGGDRERFDSDDTYRWAVHRLWIAVGNEAAAYADARGIHVRRTEPWARMYLLRNRLAHLRLGDIDDDEVWRITAIQTGEYRSAIRRLLGAGNGIRAG